MPGRTGHRKVEDFGRPILDHAKAGKTLIIENVHKDPRTAAEGSLATFNEVGVASLVHVPLVEGGQLRAILGVQFAEPRQWSAADVKLTEEVAERLWDAVRRCRAEAKLGASLEKFRVLVESSTQATWEMDPEGKGITDAANWCSYTGPTVEEAWGDGWLDAIHPEDRQAVALRWPEYMRAEEPLSEEYRLRHRDEWRWSRVRAAPIRDAHGRVVRWVGMNHDITARKETEQRIEHMALYDALTGLPRERIARATTSASPCWMSTGSRR